MKSAKILFDTIHGKCSNGDMYNWKACKPKERDNVVSFDVRQRQTTNFFALAQSVASKSIHIIVMIILLVVYTSCFMMAVIH